MRIKFPSLALLLLLSANASTFQAQTAPISTPIKAPTVTLVVLGSPTPIPVAESPRSVLVLPIDIQALFSESPQQLLRTDSSIFLEQRSGGGGQADLVLRGGSFSQSLILLNGFRVNDSQSGHHNLDLPIPLEAMESIQILHGAGSTLHGADALSGVVDFVTAAPQITSLFLRTGTGSFGENEESLLGGFAQKKCSSRLTTERDFSTGFIADRDYRNEDASLENWLSSKIGITDLTLATSDRSFGAANFYGPYDSWERTKGWFAAARQELGSRTVAAFGYRRHTDEFVLVRTDPSIYENNHIDSAWQATLNRSHPIGTASLLMAGLEFDGDSIHSNNLGIHARNRGSGFIDLDLHPANKRWTLSAGLREEIFSGGANTDLAPHLAGSLRVTDNLKLRASAGYGYRIPSYTELYYSDPVTNPNPNLKPESAWSGEGGFDWIASNHFTISATGFYSRQHDTIDYVKTPPSIIWSPVNLNGVHFQGIETSLRWVISKHQTVSLAETSLFGAQNSLNGQQSEYAYNYPTQNLRATWTVELLKKLTFENNLRLVKMYQQAGITPWNPSAYPVWDETLNYDFRRIRPYLRLTNLSNTGYQEIQNVPMQGRAIVGGLVLDLKR